MLCTPPAESVVATSEPSASVSNIDVLLGPMRIRKSSTPRDVTSKPVPLVFDSVTGLIPSWTKSVVTPLIVFRVRRPVASYWNVAGTGPVMPVSRFRASHA